MIWEYRFHHVVTISIFGFGIIVGHGVSTINWLIMLCEFGTIFINKRLMLIKEEWNTWYGILI